MRNINCVLHPAFKIGPDGQCPICKNRGTTPSPAPAMAAPCTCTGHNNAHVRGVGQCTYRFVESNPVAGTTEKHYPKSEVLDLLERAYMEGAWVGGKGKANSKEAKHYFDRWIARMTERGEL